MEKVQWKIDDIVPTKATQKLNGNDITLDLSVKDLCRFCSKEKQNNVVCCGCASWKKRLEINVLQLRTNIKNNLKSDLENKALFNEALSDFTFIVNNERIPVSKAILSARSPVFDKYFNSIFKETQENSCVLTTIVPNLVFKELIRYIYAEKVCDLSKFVFDLLRAADFYQVDGLKTICEDELLSILTKKNANKIFQAAHRYQCRFGLKEAAFNLIQLIFKTMNLTVPDVFVNNPSRVSQLFQKKQELEMTLLVPSKLLDVVHKPIKRLN